MQDAPRRQVKVRHAHRPRPVRFLELFECGRWRMKLYGLSAEHTRLLPEVVAATRELARQTLPAAPESAGAYGVGFAGAHCGRDANYVFVDWWANEDSLHQHVFISSLGEPANFRPAPDGLAAGVFDLQVIWFERNAWVEKVLANPRGPDVEAYLKKVLSDDA